MTQECTRQMLIDAHRRCQPLEELARKAIKAKRYGALAGTMTMEEYDFAFVRVHSTWTNLLADAAVPGELTNGRKE
jgi:hypothetical protein